MTRPYLQHLTSSKDLETTYEAVRAGFVAQALEKNRQATPYVEEARATEIWNLLENGRLANAANLTDDDQLASVSRWLCNL
jgi:hypothetical protein